MPKGFDIKINIDTQKSILSSKGQIYKTDRLINKTSYFYNLDKFITKLAQGIVKNYREILEYVKSHASTEMDCFKIETVDKVHAFFIKVGIQTATDIKVNDKDIIFYDYTDGENLKRRNDQRLANYLSSTRDFSVTLKSHKDMVLTNQFKKLYSLSNE